MKGIPIISPDEGLMEKSKLISVGACYGLSEGQIRQQIAIRRLLRDDMLGPLYRSILATEIEKLIELHWDMRLWLARSRS